MLIFRWPIGQEPHIRIKDTQVRVLAVPGVYFPQSCLPSVIPAFMSHTHPVITCTTQQDRQLTLGSVLCPWDSSVGLSLSLGLILGFCTALQPGLIREV